MDIDIIITKSILYSVLMVAIIAEYSLLIFVGQYFFQAALGANQLFATVITAFAIALGYKPLENFVTEATNQYFFKKKYDYQKTLKLSSEVMNLLTDIDRLVKLTTRIVCRKMELAEASTLVLDEPNHRYIVKAAESKSRNLLDMTFSDGHELFKHLFHTKSLLTKEELVHSLSNSMIRSDDRKRFTAIKKEMDSLHAQICIPCITRGKYMGNKLVAVFCLGEKKSGDAYSAEDIQLLTTLSNQAAVAVENAIMYSDLMRQFQELKNTRDQLIQADKLAVIGTMAAGIAHEIKNPLTSIQLYVQMMQKRFDDQEFRQKFNQMVPSEVERLNKIVNDLTSFAKPAKLESEPAQINDILEKTIRLSEISFKKMNVRVVRDLGAVPLVSVNQQKMMQIFLNLIKNGAESMEKGGTLTIKTYHDAFANKVCIDVKDEGHGITEENLKKLFTPFFTTKDKGTGLGLAITRRIIEEHKGEIKVKSKVGEGTTFTVELPIATQKTLR
jgi:signal transduction histidine kinase